VKKKIIFNGLEFENHEILNEHQQQ